MVVLTVPVQTAILGEGWGDVLHVSNLWDVMTATSVGEVFLLQGSRALVLLSASVLALCYAGARRQLSFPGC